MASSERGPLAHLVAALVFCATAAIASTHAYAQDDSGGRVTDALEALPELPVIDAEAVDVGAIVASHTLTIFYWYATGCPCVARYQARIEAIAATYGDAGVAVYAIASNADDDVEALRESIAERTFTLPVIHDVDAALADLFDIRSTPTTVVVDSAGNIVFHGWIDNEREPGQNGRQAWLENALDAALADGAAHAVEAPTFGCPLTRRRGHHENCGDD